MYPCNLFSSMTSQSMSEEVASAASTDTTRATHDLTSFASLLTHKISPLDHQHIPDFADQNIKTTTKKKRNQPGHPDPDAEVIALSPKTLMATNRYVCEICNKGFQRDQNLQLHRRGHNLPWKLKQKSVIDGETKKKVYVCPEPACIHHNPSRALGDLTGIKKHFSRKHGEKKWKCERCGKRYAVQSDWKAHVKTCGSREYRCDCGTLFARKDSFITHRAFCDALAEENARFLSSTTTGCHHNTLFQPFPSNLSPNPNPNPNLLDLKPLSASSTSPLPATSLLQIASNMGPITSNMSHSNARDLATWQNSSTRDFLGFDPMVENECGD